MSDRVFSTTFTLLAIVDGEDAVSLDVSPSAVVWNQEGDVTVDEETGNTTDTSKWPIMTVVARVLKGSEVDTGWKFGYSIGPGCSFSVAHVAIGTQCTFMLGAPVKIKDANGKEAAELWTNGSLKITATKGTKTLTKDIPIALNALATWKMSVVNGTMSAVSKKTETQVDGKLKTYETRLTQNETEIKTKVSQTELNAVAIGEGSSEDIDLTGKDENTLYLVLFDFVPNNPDLFIFGVKKDLRTYDTRTSYGHWVDSKETYKDKGGFETYLQWQEHFSSWGSRDIDRVINSYTKKWFINSNGTFAVGSIGQYQQDGPVYVYLRGGGKYHLYCDHIGMNIHLATQADIDKFKRTDAVPALSISLANAVEPVADRTTVYSEIRQTADNISLIVNGLQKTGIDIQNGLINAIAGMFNFVGKDKKPYIRVEQDSDGYPHVIFYNPNKKDSAGNPMPAYDLGFTGMLPIIGTGKVASWQHIRYQKTVVPGSTTNARDFYREMIARAYMEACRYNGGYYLNPQFGKVWLPAEAEKYDQLYYDTDSWDRDYLPTASLLADGWHLYQDGYKSGTFNDGTVNERHAGYWYEYTYRMFYTKSGIRYQTEHAVTVRYTDSRMVAVGYEYSIYFDGDSGNRVYANDSTGNINNVDFPDAPTK